MMFYDYCRIEKNRFEKYYIKCNNFEYCPICLEDGNQSLQVSIRRCNHSFHHKCISQWITVKRTCPVCRCIF